VTCAAYSAFTVDHVCRNEPVPGTDRCSYHTIKNVEADKVARATERSRMERQHVPRRVLGALDGVRP
jgi:hypothetical protein